MRFTKISRAINLMARADQVMRKKAQQDMTEFNSELDQQHTDKLKKIVKQIGWPTISKVGKKASRNAWLLVQHADHNLKFQKDVLKLLENHKNDNEVRLQDVAMLTDRVRVGEGKPQLFGTQWWSGKDGGGEPRTIEDQKNLNKRRQEYNLKPFAQYEVTMKEYFQNLSLDKK